MALASGLCAGGNYFNQPLLHSIATHLNVAESTASWTVTLAQVSYALGLVFLVPLGDKFERRNLAVVLILLAAVGQFISGYSSSIQSLFVGTVIAGLFSVAAQVLVPAAASLSDPARSGRAVGLVMSGLLIGILGSRSVAGVLSDLGGWNTVYKVSGFALVAVAIALWKVLPQSTSAAHVTYAEVLRSMGTLIRLHPRLRSRSLLGGVAFSSMSALFSTMALLLSGEGNGYSDSTIGLIGLAGIAGALMANYAGRMADKGFEQRTTMFCVTLLAISWGILWMGKSSLIWFVLGMVAIDFALQGIHISNQNVVYGLDSNARSRLNSVYMTSYFIGAASGSAIGAFAWQHGGWFGTCLTGFGLALAAGCAFVYDRRLARTAADPSISS